MHTGNKLSMTDIAKLAGVSVATISRVINQKGGYSKKTGDAVRQVIKDTGFVANTNAKSLRTNLSQTIGVIVPDITNEFFAKLIREIVNWLLEYNYSVFVCDSNEDEDKEALFFHNLIAKKVDGIMYISGKSDVTRLETRYQIPILYIDRSPKHAANLVHSDNFSGGHLAGQTLIAGGCQYPVMIRDSRKMSTVDQRYKGFHQALVEAGCPKERPDFFKAEVSYESIQAKIPWILEHFPAVDGIFCSNDTMALGALHGLVESGKRVPEDVQLIGFDGSTTARHAKPQITTIAQDVRGLAESACRQLMELISGESAIAGAAVIPVKLSEGETTMIWSSEPDGQETKVFFRPKVNPLR